MFTTERMKKSVRFNMDAEPGGDGEFDRHAEFTFKNERKKQKRLTKEDLIYGIWNDEDAGSGEDEGAENSDSGAAVDAFHDEELRPSFGNFRRSGVITHNPPKKKVIV